MTENRAVDRAMPVLLAALLASISPIARPFWSNQNQYFAHVIGPDSQRLQNDWLVNTVDPYPVFTQFSKWVIELFGLSSIMILAWTATFIAVYAVYIIVRAHRPEFSTIQTALVTSLVGLTIPLCVYQLSAFNGVAGQYLINQNNIFQPSSFGVLLLLAVPFWYKLISGTAKNLRQTYLLAIALTTVACVMHYTYLIVTSVAACAVILATWQRHRWNIVRHTGLAVLVITLITALANPQMFLFLKSVPGQALAQKRFAFDRIPHHTLISHWPTSNLVLVAVVLIAALLLRSKRDVELMRWVLITTCIALVCAIFVLVTKSTQLALLFPWRVSVIVIPVAEITILCWVVPKLKPTSSRVLLGVCLIICAAIIPRSGIGAGPFTDNRGEAVELVSNSQPQGVGLIPIWESNVRLNANSPVFVDWKSPPYVGGDLVQWWRRIDTVHAYTVRPESICQSSYFSSLDWALVKLHQRLPTCMKNWHIAGTSKRLKLIMRPS